MGWGHRGFCCLRQALLEDVCAAWYRAEPGELEQHCLLLLQLLPALSSAGTARSSRGCCCVMHVPASVAKGGTSPLLFPSTFRFEGLDVYSRNMHCGFLISRIFFQNCSELHRTTCEASQIKGRYSVQWLVCCISQCSVGPPSLHSAFVILSLLFFPFLPLLSLSLIAVFCLSLSYSLLP